MISIVVEVFVFVGEGYRSLEGENSTKRSRGGVPLSKMRVVEQISKTVANKEA